MQEKVNRVRGKQGVHKEIRLPFNHKQYTRALTRKLKGVDSAVSVDVRQVLHCTNRYGTDRYGAHGHG